MSKPVVIELALNGITRKNKNPAVPETPDEMAEESLACISKGAALIHTHTTTSTGGEEGAEEYAQAYRQIKSAEPKAFLYPTMSGGASINERWDHNITLAKEGLIAGGVLDPGSTNLSSIGEDGSPAATDFVYTNSPNDIRYMMSKCTELGLGASMAIYEPGFLRIPLGYYQAGKLPKGSLVKFYFSGEKGYTEGGRGPIFGPPPIPEALDLYLAMLGDAEIPWFVSVITGAILDTPIAELALQRGGHLRIGIEDNSSAKSNLDELDSAIALCEKVGREPANLDQTAEILGI